MAGFFASTTGMTRMGMLRAYWLGMVVCIGGFLCKSSNRTSLHSTNDLY